MMDRTPCIHQSEPLIPPLRKEGPLECSWCRPPSFWDYVILGKLLNLFSQPSLLVCKTELWLRPPRGCRGPQIRSHYYNTFPEETLHRDFCILSAKQERDHPTLLSLPGSNPAPGA